MVSNMRQEDQNQLKKKFFTSIIFSSTFKFIILTLLILPGIFFTALFIKIIYYVSLKDITMVDEISEILYKFGTPYVLSIIYFINFGSKNKKTN